jgi:hypothetical protein
VTASNVGDLLTQVVALAGEDERGELLERVDGAVEGFDVRVGGLLDKGQRAQFFPGHVG